MFISIQELELRNVEIAKSFAPGTIDYGPDIIQQGNLAVNGRAELLEENHGGKKRIKDIRLVGDFSTRVEVKCARCLEPVVRDLAASFDLFFKPADSIAAQDEVFITEADTEIGFYQGDGMQLEDAVREQVLLALPLKILCREDCQGLCSQCGKNRNTGACGCIEKQSDPRWAALAEIKGKLKQ